ncbi:hypothetical protein ACTFIW_002798 [Dictyostelium discoideum]
MIDKIKSERMFIYKNFGIEFNSGLERPLHNIERNGCSRVHLIAELESLKIPVRNAIPVLPSIYHANTSVAITTADSISTNNNDNTIATTTTTTINNDNFASNTNTLRVSSETRTTATLLDVNSLITATLGPTTFNTAATIGTSATTDDTTAIDTTISTTTMKKRGRPQLLKEIPENCYVCGVTEIPILEKMYG